MSRRRSAPRVPSVRNGPNQEIQLTCDSAGGAFAFMMELLETRVLFSSAFDVTQVTNLRSDPTYSSINGQGIGIAVLDTGVYAQNPDLQGNVAAYYDAVEQPLSSPVDPNFLQDAVDHQGHGSHVSGIAASTNPNIGVAYGAHLVDVRVFADTGENALPGDPVLRGLDWVAAHASTYNIKVVNLSLGAPVNLNYVPSLDDQGQEIQVLEQMGITVVSSSGNSYANDPEPGASIPAVESTISVANSFSDNGVGQYNFSAYLGEPTDQWLARQTSAAPDVFNATSQRSSLFNQLVAPGTDIYSTWNSPAQLHNTISGTSMSAPFVSGTVALMQQAAQKFGGTSLSPQQILQILHTTADHIADPVSSGNLRAQVQADGTLGPPQPLPGTGLTYDRVNVFRAVQAVKAFVQGSTGVGGDLNSVISDATPLTALSGTNSDTVTGNIGTDGSVLVGNNDIDLYKVAITAGGNLTVSLSPTSGGLNFNATLRLFDSTGAQLFISSGGGGSYPSLGTLPNQPLPIGTYYIGVSSNANNAYSITNGSGIAGGKAQGDYQLTAVLNNPDPHGIPAAAETLGLSSPNTLLPNASLGNVPAVQVTGTIGQEANADGSIITVPNGDVHFYSLVAPDTGVLIIQADADVRVFDSNNNPVGSEGSNITVPVQIGQVYYVGITTQANMNFDPTNPFQRVAGSTPPTPYDVFVAFSNGDRNGTAAQAAPANIGTPITEQVGNDRGASILGANGGNKDVDFYAFTAPTSGVLLASVSGSGMTPEMSAWQANNGIIGVKRLADANEGNSQLYEEVTAGETVLIAVTGKGNQSFNGTTDGSGAGGQVGTFTLNTSLQPSSLLKTLSNNSIQNGTPTPLPLGQTVNGNIGLDGNLVIGANDVDMYSFTAPTTAEYQFSTDTSQDGNAQTVLRVFDSSGNQIAANQSASATSTNSLVKVPMSAGQTCYIGVSGVGANAFSYNALTGGNTGAGSTGPYTITASDAGPFQRTVALQQGKKTTYTDSNGHKITVTMTGPGNGQLIFFSPNDGADIGQLMLNGTDNTSTVTIRGATTIPSVIVNGSLRSFNAPQDNLTGDMSVTGSLGALQLASAGGGHSITLGSGGRLAASLGQVTDESLVAGEPIASIRANQWTVTTASRQQISAPSIDSIVVRGAFDEDISAGTIGRVSFGTLSGSAIRASSSIAAVLAGSSADSQIFAGVQPTLTTLPASAADFASQSGSIKSLTIRGAFSNTMVAAWNIGSVVLNQVQTGNGGTPFGVTANALKHLRAAPSGGGKPVVMTNAFAPFATTSLGGDAVVRIVG